MSSHTLDLDIYRLTQEVQILQPTGDKLLPNTRGVARSLGNRWQTLKFNINGFTSFFIYQSFSCTSVVKL